ncbi:MAG: hypothetical protein CL781_07290 [Chloroflexi bacterium]|nr:hypothetical protein [Chloroflexota bacterium]
MVISTDTDKLLEVAHLLRRAGFGGTKKDIESLASEGYSQAVNRLLNSKGENNIPDDKIWRYHHEHSAMMGSNNPAAYWLYKMIGTQDPVTEKMALFWHGIFATGYPKISQGLALVRQIRMFRAYGRGNFKTLLVQISQDPAMIAWLDNNDNHNGSINENYGRELLELFSMGVGNYSEDDIKETARAFTGWTIGNTEYMALRAERDSIWPYGRLAWHYEFKEHDHDSGPKTFLGESGNFNGDDIIDVIVRQKSTARFIARHMYSFFVRDEPSVPQWPYTEPYDNDAIEELVDAYFESGYNIESMLEVLFNSEFFRSESCWYNRVKSPAELVAGVLRISGEFDRPRKEILDRSEQMKFMGQALNNPPSVEGWHEGLEWVDTGTLVERVNFSSGQLGNESYKGVTQLIDNICNDISSEVNPHYLVTRCLEELGYLTLKNETRSIIDEVAFQSADKRTSDLRGRVKEIIRLIAATHEYQRA